MSIIFLPGAFEAASTDYASALDQPISPRAELQFNYIKQYLKESQTSSDESRPLIIDFPIVTLSNIASGLMNISISAPERQQELIPLITIVKDKMLSPEVSPRHIVIANNDITPLQDDALYLSHLNLVLGIYRHITGASTNDALHDTISQHLAARTLRDGDFHVASYPGTKPNKWPADQTITLESLYLYDKTRGTALSSEPITGWLHYMQKEGLNQEMKLHKSAITDIWYKDIPRGCALSWSVIAMAQFAPDEAKELYQQYQQIYFQQWGGVGGFREMPPTSAVKIRDGDSGPVALGVGGAATGFGIGASRLVGDKYSYTEMMRLFSLATFPKTWGNTREYFLAPMLGEAIFFSGETAVPWFHDKITPPITHNTSPASLALVILMLLLVLLVGSGGYCGWVVKKLLASKSKKKLTQNLNNTQQPHKQV
jgi:hypothetical protein